MTFESLCKKIDLPSEVYLTVTALHKQLEWDRLDPWMNKLFSRDTWEEGLDQLQKIFDTDEQGYRMLTCMLQAAVATLKCYQERGIDESIFIETMAAFRRFVKEHRDSYGHYGFDRAFWTPRQLAMEEFRIGELEYEMVLFEGKKAISIHIPSDAKLTRESCEASFKAAKDFFLHFAKEYADGIYFCDSWLLAPNLMFVLPAKSGILLFQRFFHIIKIDTENDDYMEWVFKNSNLSLDEVPQNTSLQRNMKSFLLQGGKIGSAAGILIKEY